METNFFSQIALKCGKAGVKLTITPAKDDELLVTILPFQEQLDDSAKNLIQPLNLRGTVATLDAAFFQTIQQPIKKVTGLLTNMDNFNKSMDAAKERSKMEQDRQSKDKRDKDLRKKKYDEALTKVNELAAQEKYGQAIAQLPKPEDFPEQVEEIKQKMEELRGKYSQLSLL